MEAASLVDFSSPERWAICCQISPARGVITVAVFFSSTSSDFDLVLLKSLIDSQTRSYD